MKSLSLRIAAAVVRAWTWVYTSRLPADVRDVRRAEIESDLWECQHAEPPIRWLPAHILARLVLGAADDLAWWTEQRGLPSVRPVLAAAVACAVLLFAFWLSFALPDTLPAPPRETKWVAAPAPPPPPPPPCPPAGLGGAPVTPCVRD